MESRLKIKRRMFLSGLLALVLSCSGADALQVNPSLYELSAAPNKVVDIEFTVINEKEEPIILPKPTMVPWRTPQGETPRDPSEWLSFEVEPDALSAEEIEREYGIVLEEHEYFMLPGEKRRVQGQARCPESLTGGEICAMVYFEEVPLGGSSGGSMSIRTKIGAAVYMASEKNLIAGAVVTNLKISSFGGGDLRVACTVKNPGNVHIRPRIVLEAKTLDGSVLGSTEYPPAAPVFPDKAAEFILRWQNGDALLVPGEYLLTATVHYWEGYANVQEFFLEVKPNGIYQIAENSIENSGSEEKQDPLEIKENSY